MPPFLDYARYTCLRRHFTPPGMPYPAPRRPPIAEKTQPIAPLQTTWVAQSQPDGSCAGDCARASGTTRQFAAARSADACCTHALALRHYAAAVTAADNASNPVIPHKATDAAAVFAAAVEGAATGYDLTGCDRRASVRLRHLFGDTAGSVPAPAAKSQRVTPSTTRIEVLWEMTEQSANTPLRRALWNSVIADLVTSTGVEVPLLLADEYTIFTIVRLLRGTWLRTLRYRYAPYKTTRPDIAAILACIADPAAALSKTHASAQPAAPPSALAASAQAMPSAVPPMECDSPLGNGDEVGAN
ncbi:hypothetical protein AURDEDRAFT_177328 [Auricularia subglabra TFB-10046 SS5]|uniref:Uncharacterized protein n=1 Tax=Auricularia subglabra (strain TFB-10046 / SS5) TaxID=717982 RepID=J0D4D9_AURST|nr:hypothetical protein AURDEDRAFT_177328 [Auricularia subglabra TFB-10046 SS5]